MPYNPPPYKLLEKFKDSTVLDFKKGETITTTDDLHHLWIVKNGMVKRFQIISNGNISMQGFYTDNDAFPLTYVYQKLFDRKIYHGPETYYYEAMSPTKLIRVKGDELKQAMGDDPTLYRDILSIAGNRFISDIQLLENRGLHDAHRQVAHQLYFYAIRYGKKINNGTEIPLPLTQQDIADLLGLTRETVSTEINNLRHLKAVSNEHKLIICDIEKLKNIAYG